MWNGNIGKAKTLVLASLIVSIGGCDAGAAPPPAPKLAGNATQSQPPNMRYQVDPARNRVWFLTRDGVFLYDVNKAEKIVVPLGPWQWVGTPYGCLPDLALGPRGEAVITSDILPTLWRIDAETLAVSVHPLLLDADTDKDVGFSGLVYSSEQEAFFAVSYLQGSLWRIDLALSGAQKIPLSVPVWKACGLAVQPRVTQQKTSRPARLRVRAQQGEWTVDLAPDQRSAYAKAAPRTKP